MRNFIAGPNPYSIASPPEWFMRDLEAFDSELVLFFSQEQPCFQVARRLAFTRACRPSVKHPDTTVMAVHNLHPVARLLPSPFTRWGPTILQDLRARDVDAVGGGEKAADILDGFEHEAAAQLDVEQDFTLDKLSAEGWRYLTQRHFDRAKRARGEKASRSVPTIGRMNFRPGGSAVFLGSRHAGSPAARQRLRQGRAGMINRPPKIVADVNL